MASELKNADIAICKSVKKACSGAIRSPHHSQRNSANRAYLGPFPCRPPAHRNKIVRSIKQMWSVCTCPQ